MTRQQEKELVKQAYPHSKSWASKVDRMPENQVTAIFLRLKQQGKL